MPNQFVAPSTYFVGYTHVNPDAVRRYLEDTGNEDFKSSWEAALKEGISPAEALCSLFAKLCYNALTLDKNANVTRIRDIRENLIGCFSHGHGSVFEHVNFNFIISNCSRVFTHELVRHRVGTAFSQTSGRYCRPTPDDDGNLSIGFVHDPILDPVKDEIDEGLDQIMRIYASMVDKMKVDDMSFEKKKKVTSALRRLLPNGQSNEIAVSFNIRSIRHMVMMRTSRHAEWEIRKVFQDIYLEIRQKFPMVFYGATETEVDGILEISGMKLQPYERAEDA